MRERSDIRWLALMSIWLSSRELEKVDDEKNLKIAQDAIDGKFRTGTKRRRRRGIDGAASDSDTSDEEGLRRAKPPKKRNIVGDTLPALGEVESHSRLGIH